jgi:hypothetical protein
MYRPLIPCPGCARHVLASERACPFCAAAMPADFSARVRPELKGRMSRSAMAALGAALTLSACSSTVAGGDGSAPVDAPTADAAPDQPRTDAPAPDAPAPDARADASPADVVNDEGGAIPAYGISPSKDGGPDDDGGPVAEYGGPPPMDAGNNNLYGAPPRDASVDGDAVVIAPLYGSPPADEMV